MSTSKERKALILLRDFTVSRLPDNGNDEEYENVMAVVDAALDLSNYQETHIFHDPKRPPDEAYRIELYQRKEGEFAGLLFFATQKAAFKWCEENSRRPVIVEVDKMVYPDNSHR